MPLPFAKAFNAFRICSKKYTTKRDFLSWYFAKIEVDGKSEEQTVEVRSRRPITGKRDVYILFRGGDEQLFDFDWWKMSK